MTWRASQYYRGRLKEGDIPPDECIELSLWDRFGWGPEQTDRLTLPRLRMLFAILEQQKVTEDAIHNLGEPDYERMKMKERAARHNKHGVEQKHKAPPQGQANARVIRRQLGR